MLFNRRRVVVRMFWVRTGGCFHAVNITLTLRAVLRVYLQLCRVDPYCHSVLSHRCIILSCYIGFASLYR